MTFKVRNGNQPTIDMRVGSDLRYGINAADILAPGDSVASVTATVSHGTVSGPAVDGNSVVARVSGVAVGQTVELKFLIVTTQGDTIPRTLYLVVVA